MTIGFALIVAACLAADSSAAKATYFLGESQVTTPDGRPAGHFVLLLKREQFPTESKIVETMLMLSSEPRVPVTESVTIFTVDGSGFRLKAQGGTIAGKGELTGKPWEWTSWTTMSQHPGGVVRSLSQLTDRGMTVSKEVIAPNGTVQSRSAEDNAKIDGGTYELFRQKLLRKSQKS